MQVNSIRGQVRYLCHLDSYEKHKYNESEVICLNGADYDSIVKMASDRYQAIKDMIFYIEENNIFCYSDLFLYAMNNREDWFKVLCDNSTLVIKEYLKSKAWRNTL